jgi:hypothetical protein
MQVQFNTQKSINCKQNEGQKAHRPLNDAGNAFENSVSLHDKSSEETRNKRTYLNKIKDINLQPT